MKDHQAIRIIAGRRRLHLMNWPLIDAHEARRSYLLFSTVDGIAEGACDLQWERWWETRDIFDEITKDRN